jgi:hypothetical protein
MTAATKAPTQTDREKLAEFERDMLAFLGEWKRPHDAVALATKRAAAEAGLAALEAEEPPILEAQRKFEAETAAALSRMHAERQRLGEELRAVEAAEVENNTAAETAAGRLAKLQAELAMIRRDVEAGTPLSVAARPIRERLARATA